jgi:lincosamide nucleotidyltransferase
MTSEPSLQRLQETLVVLEKAAREAPNAIALVGAGSAGSEISRMDQFSDIDFFLIVEEGFSSRYINDNSWFEKHLPIVFSFRDTEHGNKALLENGVFIEFAIFTNAELTKNGIPGLRTIWSRSEFNLPDFSHKISPLREISYYVDQALSNLLVGALRLRRGERLAALSMIEHHALKNLLVAYRLKNEIVMQDPFNIERRAEQSLRIDLPQLVQGYERLEISLEKILSFSESNFEVNFSIAQGIRNLMQS